MSAASTIELSRLRDIGWDLWDPIGLKNVRRSDCEDEYDEYLLQVVSRLRRREAASDLARYLVSVENEHMGLDSRPSALSRAVATVEAIDAYLKTIPSGPLNVA